MTTRERILAIKLLEKQARNPQYTQQVGIYISIVNKPEVKND